LVPKLIRIGKPVVWPKVFPSAFKRNPRQYGSATRTLFTVPIERKLNSGGLYVSLPILAIPRFNSSPAIACPTLLEGQIRAIHALDDNCTGEVQSRYLVV
jgi:hypothetical protein